MNTPLYSKISFLIASGITRFRVRIPGRTKLVSCWPNGKARDYGFFLSLGSYRNHFLETYSMEASNSKIAGAIFKIA
jgi:hypothetical protein